MENKEELKKLNDKLSKMREDFDNAVNDLGDNSLERYLQLSDNYNNRVSPILHRIQELEDIEWGEIPKYGNLMTLESFKEYCKSGMFIDYDGSGNYASKTKMSNKTICPSDVTDGLVLKNPEFTHVVWFNK